MLVSKIGYFNLNSSANLAESSNKTQQTRITLSEGFGNYDKKNFYSLEKVNFFAFMKDSLKTIFSKDKSVKNPNNLSMIA